MASRNQPVRWYWPTFGNVADAVQASNQGMWAAVFCAVVTAIMATVSIFTAAGIAGIHPSAYLDAVLFAVIAWRIHARSKGFAIAGLCLFVIEKIFQIVTQPESMRFGIFLGIILLLCFISGVRGNFAYHRFMAEAEVAPPALPGAESRARDI
ncbi:hypothetical protein [Dyella subtropica]|uniref:hypothetical protein n=1 Tax=Dyella subtropica TaxID=2992127 RepID=UPI0022564945|nr:hypothetical protein [Dyella subtropica]